ncbi:MAG: hypothetical protein ACXWRG_16185 [Bdellovibrio sp.]
MRWSIPYLSVFIFLLFSSFVEKDAKAGTEAESSVAAKPAETNGPANATGGEASGEKKDADGAGEFLPVDAKIREDKGIVEETISKTKSEPTIIAHAPGYPDLMKFSQQYLDNKESCVDSHKGAAWACLEFLSDHMIEGAAALSAVSALGGMAIKDTCSKFSSAMDIASKALSAYTAACGIAKLSCGGWCGSALEGLDGIIKTNGELSCAPKPGLPPTQIETANQTCRNFKEKYRNDVASLKQHAETDRNAKNNISVAGKDALCKEKYTQLAISAVAGIASLAKSIMQGKNCEKNTAADVTKLAAVQPTVDQCADPKNASLPDCICAKNPRTPGCGNTFQKPGDSSVSRLAASAMGPGGSASNNAKNGLGGLDGNSGLPPVDTSNFNGSGDGGGGAGAPMGGGSAGLSGGGSGGGGGNGAGANGSGGGGLDLSKYGSGFAGGGGGAGRYGGGYSSGSGSSKYGAYLPGGAKDPTRGLAGQQAWTNEVTGQGGKSNWEKVKERYHDNKGSLINNSN